MATIGTIALNLFTTDKDEVVYVRTTNNVSHVDNATLKRTLPKRKDIDPLRTNLRFERGFSVGADVPEKSVTVSIAVAAPKGVDAVAVAAYIEECLTQGAVTAGKLGTTGDIHL